MTDRELMQQALDVLETKERFWAAYRYEAIENIQATITALRERLQQRKSLTEDEIKKAVLDNPAYGAALMSMVSDDVTVVEFRQAINGIARAIEAAHGIKP